MGYFWGNPTTGTSLALRYMAPGASDTAITSTPWPLPVTAPCTVTGIRFLTPAGGAGTGEVTFVLYLNGAPTAVTLVVPVVNTSGAANGFSVVLAPDDYVDMTLINTGTVSGGSGRFTVKLVTV